jgi:hypothetical protein
MQTNEEKIGSLPVNELDSILDNIVETENLNFDDLTYNEFYQKLRSSFVKIVNEKYDIDYE